MGFLEDIEKILSDNYKENLLIEKDITFNIKTRGSFNLYKYDKEGEKDLLPFINRVEGAKKQADAVIFLESKGNTPYVLICEMKDGDRIGEAKKQYLASRSLVEFIINTVNRVCQTNYSPKIKGICVGTKNIKKSRKRTTKGQHTLQFDTDNWCYNKKWMERDITVDLILKDSKV